MTVERGRPGDGFDMGPYRVLPPDSTLCFGGEPRRGGKTPPTDVPRLDPGSFEALSGGAIRLRGMAPNWTAIIDYGEGVEEGLIVDSSWVRFDQVLNEFKFGEPWPAHVEERFFASEPAKTRMERVGGSPPMCRVCREHLGRTFDVKAKPVMQKVEVWRADLTLEGWYGIFGGSSGQKFAIGNEVFAAGAAWQSAGAAEAGMFGAAPAAGAGAAAGAVAAGAAAVGAFITTTGAMSVLLPARKKVNEYWRIVGYVTDTIGPCPEFEDRVVWLPECEFPCPDPDPVPVPWWKEWCCSWWFWLLLFVVGTATGFGISSIFETGDAETSATSAVTESSQPTIPPVTTAAVSETVATTVPATTVSATTEAPPSTEAASTTSTSTTSTTMPRETGSIAGEVSIERDACDHNGFIGTMVSTLEVVITDGSEIELRGDTPFVAVSGTLSPSGYFVATGSGTVAGRQDVSVAAVGVPDGDGWFIVYSMGVEGKLPGDCPIAYAFDLGAGEVAVPTLDDVAAFLTDLAAWFRTGDAGNLFDHLHPAIRGVYGEDQCRAFAASVDSPDLSFEALGVGGPDVWRFSLDGVDHIINDSLSVTVDRTEGGSTTQTEIHLAVVGGQLRWFADCGDPVL